MPCLTLLLWIPFWIVDYYLSVPLESIFVPAFTCVKVSWKRKRLRKRRALVCDAKTKSVFDSFLRSPHLDECDFLKHKIFYLKRKLNLFGNSHTFKSGLLRRNEHPIEEKREVSSTLNNVVPIAAIKVLILHSKKYELPPPIIYCEKCMGRGGEESGVEWSGVEGKRGGRRGVGRGSTI